MYFYVYLDNSFQWRWTLHAANHRKIATSGESYHNKVDCLNAIQLVRGSAGAQIIEK